MDKLETKVKMRGLGYDTPVFAIQLHRTENSAIYEVKHPDGQIYYEVFIIAKKRQPLYENGKFIGETKPNEVYPKNEDFGRTAWCIRNFNRATEKYLSL